MKQAFDLDVPTTLAEVCAPKRCGLIVYDMQVGVVSQIKEGKQIQARCQEVLAAARQAGMRIFHTRHFFLPTRAAGVGQLRRAMVWQRKEDPLETIPFISQNSDSFQIVPELTPAADEVVVDKITMSAFAGSYLDLAMRDAHLDSYLIMGIALEIGIEPTVRHGLDLNYIPVLITDACGSKSHELAQRSLKTLRETGEVLTCGSAEIFALLRDHTAHSSKERGHTKT